MSQQQMSSSSSSSSTALVSGKQRSALLKFLSKAVATQKLADLQRYITKGGDTNAIIYQVLGTGRWLTDQADHTGGEKIGPHPLLAHFCILDRRAHVMLLLKNGANVNGRTAGVPPLVAAAGAGHTDLIEILRVHGAELDQSDVHSGGTALMAACTNNQLATAQQLVHAGASVHHVHVPADESSWCEAL